MLLSLARRIIACAHCRFDGNALNAHYGHHAQAAGPLQRECGADAAALIAVSISH